MEQRLLEIDEARRAVLSRVDLLGRERVAVGEALGRVLAEELIAPEPVPGFDNSAMDGFAVRAEDTAMAGDGAPVGLRVIAESRAGHPAGAAVGPGEAIAISTGAMVPEGADAVVRVEDTRPGGGEGASGGEVQVLVAARRGANVRSAGEDVREGERILGAGAVIGPAELGVIVSVARPEIACGRRPRVRMVISGDELIGAADAYRPGAVRDSNAHTVPALARRAGALVESVDHVGDDAGATRAALGRALDSDLAVVCGGVSVGEHDHVRAALAELGAEQVFWGVALRPGKPTWFGAAPGGGLAFGLPGNPVSAMVTFLLFARPALLAMQGADPAATRGSAAMASEYAKKPGRAHAVRCRLEVGPQGWLARPTKEQGSHVLTSMLGADALAIIPGASGTVAAGERVTIELLGAPTIGR